MKLVEGLLYTTSHEWVKRLGETTLVVGITDFAQGELGDVVYVDVNQVDVELKQDEPFGSIEAIKTVSDLLMPVDGTITEINRALQDSPEQVNQSPYEDGWIVKIVLSDALQLDKLLSAQAYKEYIG